MKLRKDIEEVKPLTKKAVNECAEAMRIATELREQLDTAEVCISCSGIFYKGGMVLVGTRDGVGTGLMGFLCRVDVDVLLCKDCAQSEDNITRCIQYPLRERRNAERRGQPTGDPLKDKARAVVDKMRVLKEEAHDESRSEADTR